MTEKSALGINSMRCAAFLFAVLFLECAHAESALPYALARNDVAEVSASVAAPRSGEKVRFGWRIFCDRPCTIKEVTLQPSARAAAHQVYLGKELASFIREREFFRVIHVAIAFTDISLDSRLIHSEARWTVQYEVARERSGRDR